MGWFSTRSFGHGVHPPEAKERTASEPIRQFPFAPVLVVPLSQHLGKAAIPTVHEGAEVVRGQCIGRPDGNMSVAMHAPASGRVRRIALAPVVSGKMVPAIYIEPFAASTQEVMEGRPCDPDAADAGEILAAVQQAGVVGLGGAGFPTHVKLTVPEGKRVDTIVVNGAECEPYLTTDHRVMLEQTADIFTGIRYLMRVADVEQVIVGIEANKRDAAEAMRAAVPQGVQVRVEVLEVKYPQGAEKMLIKALLGREVPSRGLPFDAGVLCINVATTAEIGRLLPHGRGIQERVITVSGSAVKDPGNYRIPIGTPLRFVLDTVGVRDDLSRVFLGGPMMGPAAANLDVPLVKGTSGVVALTERETGKLRTQREHPCIRCGYCVEACPLYLNPSELGLLAKNGEYRRMTEDFHLNDCFECGACTFVCPSHIPLVQHFRVAKAALRKEAP